MQKNEKCGDRTIWFSVDDILIGNRDFCLPHKLGGFPSEYCHDVWCEKLEFDGEKMKICLFVSTERDRQTDGQTDTRTPHDGIACTYRAAKISLSLLYARYDRYVIIRNKY